MSLKLSAQLDANAELAFELYRKYFEENKWRFPHSVIELEANPDWSGGTGSNSPHDAKIQQIQFKNKLESDTVLVLQLCKNPKKVKIEIEYRGVLNFSHSKTLNFYDDLEWRYEQFRYYDPYPDYGMKKKMFTHDIELVDGNILSVTAADVFVKWNEV